MLRYILRLTLGACLFVVAASAQEPCSVERIAGGGSIITGAGGPATQAEILSVSDARVGPDGLLYIADRSQDVIWRVLGDGTIELFAGTGERGSTGNGGPATQARLAGPESLTFGSDGSVFVYTQGDYLIRRIDSSGVMHAFAGSGVGLGFPNVYEPGMTAAEMPLGIGTRIAAGPADEVYATLPNQNRVVRIALDGTVTPIVGGGTTGRESGAAGDGGPAVDALLASPADVAAAPDGTVYIADQRNNRIRVVRTDGIIETLPAAQDPFFDLTNVREVEVDGTGRVYWFGQQFLRRMAPGGMPETYLQSDAFRFSLGPLGEVYLPRGWQVVRADPPEIDPVVVAGLGVDSLFGEGGPATQARLGAIVGIAVSPSGEMFLADRAKVQIVRSNALLERVAGPGLSGNSGDGGPAVDAGFSQIGDIALDGGGTLYISDTFGNRIRAVSADGVIRTYAGNSAGSCDDFSTSCGDGGAASLAPVPQPSRLQVGEGGALWFQDNNRGRFGNRQWVRRISSDGIIETVDPVDPKGSVNFANAFSIAVDSNDRLLVFARPPTEGNFFYSFDSPTEGRPAETLTNFLPDPLNLMYMAYAPSGALFVADGASLRMVSPDGSKVSVLATVENHTSSGFAPLRAASFGPLTVEPGGDVYFSSGAVLHRIHEPQACDLPARPEIAIEGVRHGASFKGPPVRFVSANVSPGQIIAIFGRRLGPAQLAGGQIADGRVTTEIGGVRVLIDGQPAPLLFASSGQLGAIVPYGTSTEGARLLQVEVDGVFSESRQVQIVEANPGVFTLDSSGRGPAAALNQDGSLNTADNPARIGEIVVLWATGEGQTNPPGVDGLIANAALPQPDLPVKATIGGLDAEVLYAGAGPGMVAGAMQVNLRVPSGLTPSGLNLAGAVAVVIEVGENQYSQALEGPVTLFVRP